MVLAPARPICNWYVLNALAIYRPLFPAGFRTANVDSAAAVGPLSDLLFAHVGTLSRWRLSSEACKSLADTTRPIPREEMETNGG